MSIADWMKAYVSMSAPSSGNRNRKKKFRVDENRLERKYQTHAKPVIA